MRVSHCACSDRGFTPGQQSIGILVTLQIHNLHLKKKKEKEKSTMHKISLRRGEDSHT